MANVKQIKLNDGNQLPSVGFGMWQLETGDAVDVIQHAIDCGYRSFDSAAAYGNEEQLGAAVNASNIDRDQLFITTKLWNDGHGDENTVGKAFEESMSKLGLDQLDMYLMHWPTPMFDDFVQTWQSMEKLKEQGRVKSIGVCNFNQEHLQRLMNETGTLPCVNQIECHPQFQQKELRQFCRDNGIAVEAWSPIGQGKGLLEDPTLNDIAERNNATPAQVVLAWHLQEGNVVIPKSKTPSRIESNLACTEVRLSNNDIAQIDAMDSGRRLGPDPASFDRR